MNSLNRSLFVIIILLSALCPLFSDSDFEKELTIAVINIVSDNLHPDKENAEIIGRLLRNQPVNDKESIKLDMFNDIDRLMNEPMEDTPHLQKWMMRLTTDFIILGLLQTEKNYPNRYLELAERFLFPTAFEKGIGDFILDALKTVKLYYYFMVFDFDYKINREYLHDYISGLLSKDNDYYREHFHIYLEGIMKW